MPTVPVSRERRVAPRPLVAPRQDPGTTSAGGTIAVGRALEQTAGVLEQVYQRERDDADRASLLEADTGLDTWENENVLDAEKGAFTKKGKDAFDLPNQVLPKYDEEAKRIESTLPSERSKLAFRAQSQRRRQQISSSLERHEYGERQEFYDNQDAAKLASSSQMIGNYYNDPKRIGSELAKQDAVIESRGTRKGWAPEQIEDAKRAAHSNAHTDVVNRYLARGEFKRGRIYFDEVRSQISADEATRIEAHFTAERERVKTEVKQSMNDQLRDISAAAAAGLPVTIPSESTLKAIYGEHEGGQRYKLAVQAKEISPQVAQMKQLSESELLKFVADSRPKQQEGAADQQQMSNFLEQRAGEILRERKKDPAGYMVANAPASKEAWMRFTQAQTQPERDAAAKDYLAKVRADRERLGITGADVLPDSYADQVADSINNPKSAEALVDDIEREARRWGGSWASVYQQLAPKLSDTAAVIGSGVPRATAVALASVAGLKEDELKKMLPPGTQWKDLEESVKEELEDFQRSLPPSAARMNNAFRESVTRLAARYMQDNASKSDAITRAYRELITNQEQLVEFRGTPMRIPARGPDAMPEDVAERAAAIAVSKYNATNLDVEVPPGGFVTAEEYVGAHQEDVRERGYWLTGPNGDGLRLYLDGGPVTSVGKPVGVTWQQLRALEAAAVQQDNDRWRAESVRRQLAR